MTTAAWIFMLSAWTVILLSTIYCFRKLVTSDQQLGDD